MSLSMSVAGGALFADARDVRGDATVNDWSRYTRFQIDLDRTRFAPGEDIPVRFRVANTGYNIVRVFPSLENGKTFQFLLTDRAGHEIPLRFSPARVREEGDRPMRDLNGEPVKEIVLHPGETFEKVIFLNDYFALTPGTEYRISGYCYPDARYNFFVRSVNTAQIRIDRNRDDLYHNRHSQDMNVDSGIGLSPEETVYLFLSAEIQGNWANYLKYLELRKYIRSYDRFASRFARSNDSERPAILREFAGYLTSLPSDRLKKFRILKMDRERTPDGELLEGGRAFVTVQAERETRGSRVRYEYLYTLEPGSESASDFWKIIDVSARVIR